MSSSTLVRVTILLALVLVGLMSYCQAQDKYSQMYRGPVIDCDEISGYLNKLKEFFNEECSKLDDGCPWKVRKAIKWYGRVAKQIHRMCNGMS